VDEFRVGLGLDMHQRDETRELWLAGVRFEGEAGLLGHSDGDAACHAIADALLGAAVLGDIGQHFPDSDAEIQGIAGLELLARTVVLVREAGLEPVSCDVTMLCERPAIAPRRDEMRSALAGVLGVPVERVSLKATRPEGLGLSGDGVGCLALAILR
jgi:2-C-methyl-D-erythritol 2,4-cyclodiphosphate synthase